jgi:hypothetical protein
MARKGKNPVFSKDGGGGRVPADELSLIYINILKRLFSHLGRSAALSEWQEI